MMDDSRSSTDNSSSLEEVEVDIETRSVKRMVSMPFSAYQETQSDNSSEVNMEKMEEEFQGPAPQFESRSSNTFSLSKRRTNTSSRFCFRQRFTRYCTSQRGHELTVALSAMVVLVLTMVGLALMLSNVFGADSVTKSIIDEFFVTLYSSSISVCICLLLLGLFGFLTNDRLYRDQSETNFLRGGVICLGTGGIVYHAISLFSHSIALTECQDLWGIVLSAVAMIFIIAQIAFIIKYSRVRINKTVWLSVSSRCFLAIVMATNMCVWVRTVISESMEEIAEGSHTEGESPDHFEGSNVTESWISLQDAPIRQGMYTQESAFLPNTSCNNGTLSLKHTIQPYTWPLLIEFCVTSTTLLIAIWEKCGHGLEVGESLEDPPSPTRHKSSLNSLDFMEASKRFSSQGSLQGLSEGVRDPSEDKRRYYNTQFGFLIGWIMICCAIVLIIIYLYYINTNPNDDHNSVMMTAIYSADMCLSAICLITVPITIMKMRTLTFRDDEMKRVIEDRKVFTSSGRAIKRKGNLQRSIDRQLLGFTNLAHMAFHVMTMIAATDNDSAIIFANGFISVVMACVQTVFINWYAMQKRSKTENDLAVKPGRQCLEILRCGNFALWLVNTFLVRHPGAKRIQYKTFGIQAWSVVSNVFQPLLILYHFHVVCCIAEVINHSYTIEYIGVIRPSKLAKQNGGILNPAFSPQKLRRKSYSESNIYIASHPKQQKDQEIDSGVWHTGDNGTSVSSSYL